MSTHQEKYLGALMSDLVAGVHALVTEEETGAMLEQREHEICATLNAIDRIVAVIKRDRNEKCNLDKERGTTGS